MRRRERQPSAVNPTHMKKFVSGFCGILALGLATLQAQDGSLPFPVSLGGQAATYKAGEPFAKVARPVKSDAAIDVTAKADMIIINVNKTNEKGEPEGGGQPAVILLQGTNKGALDKSMDKRKFAAGNYLLSVVAEGKTASILFKIELGTFSLGAGSCIRLARRPACVS
jgi:hypothetical protein